jgi:hypothetical protein
MDLNKDFHDEFKVIGNMTTLDCQVVMLPTENMSKLVRQISTSKLFFNSGYSVKSGLAQPQHLYFPSNEVIKEGDWIFEIGEWDIKSVCQSLKNWTKEDHEKFPNDKKIVASTDSSLGLPTIPKSFLKQYVAANGKIDKVKLFLECVVCFSDNGECKRAKECCERLKLKLTAANEVVIVDIEPKDTRILDNILPQIADGTFNVDKELEDAAKKAYPYYRDENKGADPINAFKAGAEWQKQQSAIADIDIQASEKVYSEADMYMAIHHVYKATSTDGFFGGNVRFKELYSHFANNKEKILQWHHIKK